MIATPNPASEALHRACGFARVGVLPEVGHKFGRWIDTAFWALVFDGLRARGPTGADSRIPVVEYFVYEAGRYERVDVHRWRFGGRPTV